MSLDQAVIIVKHQSTTRDAFLGGRLIVSQPGAGFRAGLDSVLLGASVSSGAKTLLDLGAGVGTASLVALADLPLLSATLAERDAPTAALAAANITDNGFAARASIVIADVTGKGAALTGAGLQRDHYDTVIANPPFFASGRGTMAPDSARADARHMHANGLDLWVKTAATCASPGGEIIFIHLAESLPVLLPAFDQRFGALTILPFAPRPGEAASRVLIRGIKGSRAPMRLISTVPLHGPDGRAFLPEIDAIFRGARRLDW
jgi:tRNA1(Val) A37 N6-methylase TrmN6